jgi:hypothetical protein
MTDTDTMEKSTETQLKEALAEIAKLKNELKGAPSRIAKAEAAKIVVIEALAAGVSPDAEVLKDLTRRIEDAGWTMKEGRAVMIGADGYPGDKAGPAEWVKKLPKHFFESKKTGPAGEASVPTDRSNPWSKDGWDDMAQAAAYRADPVKAEQLAKAVGSRIGALRDSPRNQY